MFPLNAKFNKALDNKIIIPLNILVTFSRLTIKSFISRVPTKSPEAFFPSQLPRPFSPLQAQDTTEERHRRVYQMLIKNLCAVWCSRHKANYLSRSSSFPPSHQMKNDMIRTFSHIKCSAGCKMCSVSLFSLNWFADLCFRRDVPMLLKFVDKKKRN